MLGLQLFVDSTEQELNHGNNSIERHCIKCLFEWMLFLAKCLFKINIKLTDSYCGMIWFFQICTITVLNQT